MCFKEQRTSKYAQLSNKLYVNAVCKKKLAKESQTPRCTRMTIEQEVP